jgi:uracil-DNA glycosylase family 4
LAGTGIASRWDGVTPEERKAALEAIAAEVRECDRCRLASGRTHAVPGEGNPETEVVFVGEGPGQNEDQQGRPFVGAAGGLLNELLAAIGWRRGEVFITNVVKCRPPGNRDPEPDEVAACAPYLKRQLEVIDPALMVTLGRFSMQSFMPGARIGQVHGTRQPVDPATGAPDALAYAMYHPAAAFRQQALRDTMRADMCGIPDALQQSRALRAEHAATLASRFGSRAEAAASEADAASEASAGSSGAASIGVDTDASTDAAPDMEAADILDAMASDLVTAAPWPDRAPDPDQMGFF